MELSAILAIIFCAFVMMHRVDKRLSKDSHVVIRNGLKEFHLILTRSPRTGVVCPLIPAIQIRSTRLDGLRRPSINKWNIDDVSSSGNHHFYLARCDMRWRINPFDILEYCSVLCHTSHHHRFQIFIGFLADIYFEFYTKGNRFNFISTIWWGRIKNTGSPCSVMNY